MPRIKKKTTDRVPDSEASMKEDVSLVLHGTSIRVAAERKSLSKSKVQYFHLMKIFSMNQTMPQVSLLTDQILKTLKLFLLTSNNKKT